MTDAYKTQADQVGEITKLVEDAQDKLDQVGARRRALAGIRAAGAGAGALHHPAAQLAPVRRARDRGALINKAIELGYERKAEILRVDCWAHAPGLVRWYEKQGFTRSNRFELNGWQGQIFTMEL